MPPPFGIIQLAAYLEREIQDVEIKVVDCNVEKVDWIQLENKIEKINPDIVASSALATCNTFLVARTLQVAKKINPSILTVTGGQHFSAIPEESLEAFPEIDIIVRGEGEVTFTELVKAVKEETSFSGIDGLTYRENNKIVHNKSRELIEDLDKLPYPGYHFVSEHMLKYHFKASVGSEAPYALIEGSRGCQHRCVFCSQWCHWNGTWRQKSPNRIAEEMVYCYEKFGSRFIWLTDDNFGFGERSRVLAESLIQSGIIGDLMWFTQARCDDVIKHESILPVLRESGLRWVLLGVENSEEAVLESFNKNSSPEEAIEAVKVLKRHDIFAQAMFIIGERGETKVSVERLRKFANELDPDFAIFGILTPFPGTLLYEEAKEKGWIEERNWAKYDMINAIMPSESMSRPELQDELYKCYRSFYGSWSRRFNGLFSSNSLKRRIYWYMLGYGILNQLRKIAQSIQ